MRMQFGPSLIPHPLMTSNKILIHVPLTATGCDHSTEPKRQNFTDIKDSSKTSSNRLKHSFIKTYVCSFFLHEKTRKNRIVTICQVNAAQCCILIAWLTSLYAIGIKNISFIVYNLTCMYHSCLTRYYTIVNSSVTFILALRRVHANKKARKSKLENRKHTAKYGVFCLMFEVFIRWNANGVRQTFRCQTASCQEGAGGHVGSKVGPCIKSIIWYQNGLYDNLMVIKWGKPLVEQDDKQKYKLLIGGNMIILCSISTYSSLRLLKNKDWCGVLCGRE